MYIRKARREDLSRIAEILVFDKRMSYRGIFHNDEVSFNELQVIPTAKEYESLLDEIWVYDDGIVKGMIHIAKDEVKELYVDYFFQRQGIGKELLTFALHLAATHLWVLEKNKEAIRFYECNGFHMTGKRKKLTGTSEYNMKMEIRK